MTNSDIIIEGDLKEELLKLKAQVNKVMDCYEYDDLENHNSGELR